MSLFYLEQIFVLSLVCLLFCVADVRRGVKTIYFISKQSHQINTRKQGHCGGPED